MSWVASQTVGWLKVRVLSTALPSSNTTMVGAAATPSTVMVCSRASSVTRFTTSPVGVPTRIVTGIRNTLGVVNLIPVESVAAESSCVCFTVRTTLLPAVSYAAATVSSGYPAWYTHSSQNQSRFSPVAASTA